MKQRTLRAHRRHALLATVLVCSLFAAIPVEATRGDDGAAQQRVGRSAAALYKRAQTRIDQDRFDEARKLLETALAKYPDSGVFASGVMTEPYYPHYLLGVVYMEQEEFSLAIEQFQEEQARGQIQHDPLLFESLTLRLARAQRTDTQEPVIRTVGAEVVESVLEEDRERADVRFHGVIADAGGVGSLTIGDREINFKQDDDGFAFDQVLQLDPVPETVQLKVVDIAGNLSRVEVPIGLPPLDLGDAVDRVHALIVGVNRYVDGPGGGHEGGSLLRHQDDDGGAIPDSCPADDNPCASADQLHCYNLADLNAAAQDAERVHRFLLRRGVPPENLTLLVSRAETVDATYDRVKAALDDLATREGDTVLFFFAGHGINSKRQKNLMLVSDTRQWECGDTASSERTELERSSIGVDEVERALMRGRFLERYVILDACRTPRMASTRSAEGEAAPPAGFSSRGLRLVSDEPADTRYGREPVVFYATFDRSVSVEWNVRKAGYFTWFLLQGLRRDLSLWELKTFVQDEVQSRTRADHGLTQKPHVVLPESLENDYKLQKRTRVLGGASGG